MTYYEVLEIDSNASTDEIERAFRRLARKVHPDLNKGDAARAETRMKLLNEIRETLTDPLLRAGYDDRLRLEAMRQERATPRPAPAEERTPVPEPRTPTPEPTPAAPPRRSVTPAMVLVTVGVGAVAMAAYLFWPHLDDKEFVPSAPGAITTTPSDAEVAPLLTTPVMASSHSTPTEAPPPRSKQTGRGVVHLGSTADDVLRILGPPDGIEPGKHPGETLMRYGTLRLQIKNGRVAGGGASVR